MFFINHQIKPVVHFKLGIVNNKPEKNKIFKIPSHQGHDVIDGRSQYFCRRKIVDLLPQGRDVVY